MDLVLARSKLYAKVMTKILNARRIGRTLQRHAVPPLFCTSMCLCLHGRIMGSYQFCLIRKVASSMYLSAID